MSKSQKIWKEITADKKRFGMLVACALIGLLMWGRLLLKKVPKTAVATPSAVAQVKTNTDDLLGGFKTMKIEVVDLPDNNHRNLFAMDTSGYEKQKVDVVEVEVPNPTPKVTDDDIRQKLQAEISSLKLQSTLMGQNPRALINSKLFGLGGTPMNGFEITKITQHGVVLQNGKFVFELKMYRNN